MKSAKALKLANNFAALDGGKRLINATVNILRDKSDGAVAQTELSAACVRTAEVIEMAMRVDGNMVGRTTDSLKCFFAFSNQRRQQTDARTSGHLRTTASPIAVKATRNNRLIWNNKSSRSHTWVQRNGDKIRRCRGNIQGVTDCTTM